MSTDQGGLEILAVSSAVPEHSMSQHEAVELARQVICRSKEQAALINVLYRRAGVSNRYTVVPSRRALEWLSTNEENQTSVPGPTTAERMAIYRREAGPLSCSAASMALEQAAIAPQKISHLITVSCTGFHAPGIDFDLMERLCLRPTVERIHVGFMGCHGSINALRVALAVVRANPSARVLLTAVELCSLHFQYGWDPELLVGNAIFGDGAAAMVGKYSAESDRWRVVATASCLLPESRDAMSWTISDHGFQMQLSARVPELIGAHLRPWLESWLQESGLRISDIGSWDIHPGGPRILMAVESALGLDERATAVSREVLRDFGNLSSPTVLFILQRLMEQQAPRPCVMLAFGPGLVAEAALLC